MALGTVATIATIASTALSSWQQFKAGKETAEAGRKQREAQKSVANTYDYNAYLAGLQAQDAVDRAALEEQRFRESINGLVASQRAAFAGNNIDVTFGSPVDVMADTVKWGEYDARQIRVNGMREAWGYKVEAIDLREKAKIARKEGIYLEAAGRSAAQSSYLGATTSILGSGASLLERRYAMKPPSTNWSKVKVAPTQGGGGWFN